jgi:hypothetical protein
MVQAMVLSSFLVACVAFVFAAVILKRGQTPEDLDGVRAIAPPAPLPTLPALEARPAAPLPGPAVLLPPAALPPVPVPSLSLPPAATAVSAIATGTARNSGFARFAPRRSRTATQAAPR